MEFELKTDTGSDLGRELIMSIEADQVNAKLQQRLQQLAKEVRLNGFRPGKIPLRVVEKRYGAGARQEILGELLQKLFLQAIEEHGIQPVSYPTIEPNQETTENSVLQFVAKFEIFPEIPLDDFSKITVEKPNVTLTDQDVDKTIEDLRDRMATYEAKQDSSAQIGDQVTLNYKGFLNNEPFEGGTADNAKIILGSGHMIPGFEEGLVGLKTGDKKSLELTFPEKYHAENLAGKEVVFECEVQEVASKVLPELNDDFFAKFIKEEVGLTRFREEVLANLDRQLNKDLKAHVKEQVMSGLLTIHDFPIPGTLLTKEMENLRKNMFKQFQQQAPNIDENALPLDMFKDSAIRRIKLGLLLEVIIEKNNIKPDSQKIRKLIEDIAASYESPEEVVNWYYANNEKLEEIERVAQEEQVVDFILEQVVISDKELSYTEWLNRNKKETPDSTTSKVAQQAADEVAQAEKNQ